MRGFANFYFKYSLQLNITYQSATKQFFTDPLRYILITSKLKPNAKPKNLVKMHPTLKLLGHAQIRSWDKPIEKVALESTSTLTDEKRFQMKKTDTNLFRSSNTPYESTKSPDFKVNYIILELNMNNSFFKTSFSL